MVQLARWLDVWDRSEELVKHQADGINLHNRLNKFLSEFSKLQKEASLAQRKLCEKYFVDTEKYFGTENSYGDVINGFLRISQQILDAESLIPSAFEMQSNGEVKNSIDDEKKRLKSWKHQRVKLSSEMKSQTRIIDEENKRYRDKLREMVKAREEHERIESDATHSQFEVNKSKSIAQLKVREFERARKDYEAALGQYNLYRKDHYNRILPSWAQVGFDLGKDRYGRTQALLAVLCERVRVAIDRLNTVCGELQNIFNTFQLDQDTDLFLSAIRSGLPFPTDIAFVDLAKTYTVPDAPAEDAGSETNSGTYMSTGWSASFYPSVSAADLATWTNAGLIQDSMADGQIYAGTGSLYSTFSNVMNGGTSRRPSVSSSIHTATSPSGTGRGLLRRFFSRRSRSVANMKLGFDGTGEADYRTDGRRTSDADEMLRETHPLPKIRDLLDSSDFSDTSFESDKEGVNANGDSANAYAFTSILAGLPHEKKPEAPAEVVQPTNNAAPLAEPESLSVAPGLRIRTKLDEVESAIRPTSRPDTRQLEHEPPNEQPVIHQADSHPSNHLPMYSLQQTGVSEDNAPRQSSHIPSSISNGKPSHYQTRAPARPPPMALTRRARSDAVTPAMDSAPTPNAQRMQSRTSPSRVEASLPGPRLPLTTPHDSPSHTSSSSQLSMVDHRRTDRVPGGSNTAKYFYPRKPQTRSPNGSTDQTSIVMGECVAMYDFAADGFDPCYLAFEAGAKFYLLAPSVSENTNDWLKVLRSDGHNSGYVPTAFMEQKR